MNRARRRGFADFALEVFYIDFIEAGCTRKAPFVIRTKDQWEMFQKTSCTSLTVRVIQRASELIWNWNGLKTSQLKFTDRRRKSPSESDEPPDSNEDASLPPESPNNERVDSFSASDSDSDSEEEVKSALKTMNMIRPTRLGRLRTLTSRTADFLQAGMAGMWSGRV